MIYAFQHFERFMRFVHERYLVAIRRNTGSPRPWTTDPILSQYKFTNVYREWDRVTVWIRERWRIPHAGDKHLWFAMVIARLVNHPPTLVRMPFPGRWNKSAFLAVMKTQKELGQKAFGSAYIVSTGGLAMNKAEYLASYVLDPMWGFRDEIAPMEGQSLLAWFNQISLSQGMGSFMAAQIVADMKYVAPLSEAHDWWTFASSGPGSRKGMSYVMGLNPNTNRWKEHEWREALSELAALTRPVIKTFGMPRMHAQDLQNCLCEYSKYRRTELGTGRPKQKFVPFQEA